jgi:hypothetical protein
MKTRNKLPPDKGLFVWIIILQPHMTLMAYHDLSLPATTINMTNLTSKALAFNNSIFDNIVSITDIGTIVIKEETLIFEQKLSFEKIYEELLNAKQLIQTLNPNDFSDLQRVTGTDSQFKISNSLSSVAHAANKCFENNGIQITFEEFIASKIRTNRTILLNNRIFVAEGNIKCV